MRKLALVLGGVVAVGSLFALNGVAQATVVFTPGNNPQPDEENVIFETSQTGTTITGDTNQSNTQVRFTSTESLSTHGNGQASLVATDGNPITGTVTFTVPGHTFDDYIFDPMHGTGTATVTAVATDGTFTDSISLGNGQNFLTITTTGGETISSVAISAPGGFATYDQPRVSGLAAVPAPLIGHGLPVLLAVGGLFFGAKLLERSKTRRSLGTDIPHAA